MNFLSDILSDLGKVLELNIFLIISIFIIWFFIHLIRKNSKLDSKVNKYFVFSFVVLTMGCLALFMMGIEYFSSKFSSDSSKEADGFTIESYNVKLNVGEDSVVDVTETLTVNFYESGHHGIYKFIPSWLEYTGKDGNTISRKSKIKNLKALEDEYSLDKVNGKDKIKIGSPDHTLSTGIKTYTITYQYDMGGDPFDGFDEFIFHTFGDYWGTQINDASIEVTMPEAIDENSIKFFSDKYRSDDISSYVDYYVVDNTLYAYVSSSYVLTKSLTVDIELPEGYFKNLESNYGYSSMILCLLIILFLIIVFIKWLRYGKNYDKCSETVEFYAPENYDSAEIGYIYKKDSGRKLAIAIIVELASKGFIRIDESDDKTVRTITNLCPIDVNKVINRKISITKIKDAKSASDKEIMNNLFEKDSTSGLITDKFNYFYSSTKNLVSKGYIQINSDSIDDYTKDEIDKITNQMKKKAFAGKPSMTSNEKLVYDQLFADGDVNVLSDDKEFYKVFGKITENLQLELDDKINDVNSYKNMAITSFLFFVSVVYFIFAFSIFKDLNPRFKVFYLLAFLALIIIFILVILMRRKNTYGEQIMAKVKGFKNYLETAEKDQINKLVNDNSNYFYDILPYAYVLGVSKTWIEKFEDIPVPKSNMGNFDYTNMDSFNSLSDSVYSPSSSSSSSCGGGCSSCGGGGSW